VKSQQRLKLRILDYIFTCFLNAASKNVKSRVFWIFKKLKIRILEVCFVVAVLTMVLLATSQHLVTLECEEGTRPGGQCTAERVELTVWGRHWYIEPSLRQQLVRDIRDRTLRCYATSTMINIAPNGL